MKHKLPYIEDIIKKDFILIAEEESCNPKVLCTTLKQDSKYTPNSPIFYSQNQEIHFLYSSYLTQLDDGLSEDKLPWLKTILIPSHKPLSEMIRLFHQYEIILVKDQFEEISGYLSAHQLLKEVFHSYQYIQAYFETIIQTVDASISLIDEQGKTIVWTSGAEEIFSIKKEEIIDKPISNFFPEEMIMTMKSLQTGKSVYRAIHQPRKDLFVLINNNPIRLNGKIIGSVAAETDITNQIRLNQQLFDATTRVHFLSNEMAKLSPSTNPFQRIKGTSTKMKQTIELIHKIGLTKAPVLILGESGVGKELFATAIHELREKKEAPFIAINCGAIPATLFESELFGYEKGAFSGANQKGKKGKIELAQGGTLFLDEVGELPLEMQVKLLRVLQEHKYYAVGGTKQLSVDFRVVAATNRDLESLVKDGLFREDLYYRLNVFTVQIPPLRERKEDIIELTHYFLYEFSAQYHRQIHGVSQEIMQELLNYQWQGNIRELRNTIERLVVYATDGILRREDLPFAVSSETRMHNPLEPEDILSLEQELDAYEKKVILKALSLEEGSKIAVAKRLGISRASLYNKIKKFNIPLT